MPSRTVTPSSNGVVAMPIKTITLTFDDIGYAGWWCKLRSNPRAEQWDKFLSDSNIENAWKNFSIFILDWNFGDEHGKLLPLPKEDGTGTKLGDLPIEIPISIINKYTASFNSATELPKEPNDNSSDT